MIDEWNAFLKHHFPICSSCFVNKALPFSCLWEFFIFLFLSQMLTWMCPAGKKALLVLFASALCHSERTWLKQWNEGLEERLPRLRKLFSVGLITPGSISFMSKDPKAREKHEGEILISSGQQFWATSVHVQVSLIETLPSASVHPVPSVIPWLPGIQSSQVLGQGKLL